MHFLRFLLSNLRITLTRMIGQQIRLRADHPQLAEHKRLLVLRGGNGWNGRVTRKSGSLAALKHLLALGSSDHVRTAYLVALEGFRDNL